MALKRYVGPHPEVRVVVAGTELGTVENGGAIAVPDELADQVAWSDDLWKDVSKDSREKKKAKAEEKAVKEAGSANAAPENDDDTPGGNADTAEPDREDEVLVKGDE